jgi:hypothetical protein
VRSCGDQVRPEQNRAGGVDLQHRGVGVQDERRIRQMSGQHRVDRRPKRRQIDRLPRLVRERWSKPGGLKQGIDLS